MTSYNAKIRCNGQQSEGRSSQYEKMYTMHDNQIEGKCSNNSDPKYMSFGTHKGLT